MLGDKPLETKCLYCINSRIIFSSNTRKEKCFGSPFIGSSHLLSSQLSITFENINYHNAANEFSKI